MVLFFPGQGSQFVGMGKDLYEQFDITKTVFEQANDIIGFDLQTMCFNGPETDLTNTRNAQPAILTYQYVLTSILKEQGIVPTAVAGHSLGEFSAILASEILDFESALKLVIKRGQLMAEADPSQKGGMAAVLGLDDNDVISLCQEISQTDYVEPVNFNTPGQVVISGLKEGITKASESALEKGAKRVLPLAVSGAFHSRLMNDAAEEFGKYVDTFNFNVPICPIISNVTALPYTEQDIKHLLPLQMKSPVQWVKTVEYLVGKGFNQGIEVSSGSVISGMIRKITKDFSVESIVTYLGS